jgi:oligosaccharide repeat unit polymerase
MAAADFSYDRLLSAYGTGDKRYDETTILETGTILFAVGANWVALWCAIQRSTKRTHRLLLLIPAFLLLLFAILRGNRNIALILALPVCVHYLRGRRLRISGACLAAILAYVGLYLVGVIRNVGFAKVGGLQITSSAFDPLSGELGTLYGVHEKTENTSLFDNEWWLGRSYLIDPVVNLVPRQLWADRPLTVAQAASFAYYGGGRVGFGIGFSPIIEAKLNFGPVGCMLLFAILPVLIGLIERPLDKPNGLALLCYGATAPMLVNFWRIDFATAIKMLVLFFLALAACARLVIGRQRREVEPRLKRIPSFTLQCTPASPKTSQLGRSI